MASPAVTLCERSYHSVTAQPGRFAGHYPHEGCDNPALPCSVRLEHRSHDWLVTFMFFTPAWRHCTGVSLPGERRVGA